MSGSDPRLSRRKMAGLLASAPLLATGACATTRSTQEVRERLPVLARHEGVWDGMFRCVDATGKVTAEFSSGIIKRFLPDEHWPKIYHQTNQYVLPDGTR
jgi:hypothetical protein